MAKEGRTKTTAVTLRNMSAEVLSAMIQDNIVATPENYHIYFEKILEEKPEELQEEIRSILEIEHSNNEEINILRKANLKNGLTSTKQTIEHAGKLRNTLSMFHSDLAEQLPRIKCATDKQQLRKHCSLLCEKMYKAHGAVKKHAKNLKESYTQTVEIISKDDVAIHEAVYGVYRKNYLLDQLERESELTKKFRHSTSLLAIRVKKDTLEVIQSESMKKQILRLLAKMLLESSRRSDVVAHYGEETFMLFLRHTGLENAKKNANRLKSMAQKSNFFFNDMEVNLSIDVGISLIKADRSADQSVQLALEALELAGRYDLPAAAVTSRDMA